MKSIFLVEEFMGKGRPMNKFYILKRKILGKEQAKIINLDIDPRGGLKIIDLGKKFNLNYSGGFRENLIIKNVKGNFVPIHGYQYGENITIDKNFHDIFNNKYLSTKEKFVLVDGVIEKVRFIDEIMLFKADNKSLFEYKII